MSIAKFMTICTKNTGSRGYSDYIKMIQHDGRQSFIHSNGFYAACFSQRVLSDVSATFLIPLCNTRNMELTEYPDVNGAVSHDMTQGIISKDVEEDIKAGHKILSALKVTKINVDTKINPVTGEIFHDKETHSGSIKASYLSQFVAMCDYMQYHGAKDGCHSFTLACGKNWITLFVAGMV